MSASAEPSGARPRSAGGGSPRASGWSAATIGRGRQRRLHGEDRAPVERLREDPAERGPDRGAERAGSDPERDRPPSVAAQDDEQRQRRGEQERGADPLGDASRRRATPRLSESAHTIEETKKTPSPASASQAGRTRRTNGSSANAPTTTARL